MAQRPKRNLNKLRILQWNIQGIRAKQEELQAILHNQLISIACIQETLLEDKIWNPPRTYSIEKSPHIAGEGNRGAAILLHKAIPYTRLHINTTLEAVAVKLYQKQSYTICCLYLSPNLNVRKEELIDLFNQLPAPFLILGDFNAKHPLWDKNNPPDQRGKMLEKLLLEKSLGLYNDEAPTHYHVQTGSHSTIDLSLGSLNAMSDFEWEIDDSLHSSDHYPIYITTKEYTPSQDTPR